MLRSLLTNTLIYILYFWLKKKYIYVLLSQNNRINHTYFDNVPKKLKTNIVNLKLDISSNLNL